MKNMTDSMYELEQVLRRHAAIYSKMEPTDAVKLIYQNEFGGGHLIRSASSFLDYLQQEYASVTHDSNATAYEEIGNGIIRVHLAAVQADELEQLGSAFLRSAAIHTGNLDSFVSKLEVLRRLTAKEVFGFDTVALEKYLDLYAAAGYPMVSHSDAYRKAYKPAYRIVCARCL